MGSLEEILGGITLGREAADEFVVAVGGASKEALRQLAGCLSELVDVYDVVANDTAVCVKCAACDDLNQAALDIYRAARDWAATLSTGMRVQFFGA
jgi:hypothetical protein